MPYKRGMPTASKSKKSKKPVVVDRKFLTDLARSIYDSKNKRFLRLCNGTLQNGPDPTDPKRPMHCGLGELYFAMTGRQPESDGVDEDEVVRTALDLSTLESAEKARERALDAIDEMDVSENMKDMFRNTVDDSDDDDLMSGAALNFKQALDDIPNENDDHIDQSVCTLENYKARSKRVAKQLRYAATFLPK